MNWTLFCEKIYEFLPTQKWERSSIKAQGNFIQNILNVTVHTLRNINFFLLKCYCYVGSASGNCWMNGESDSKSCNPLKYRIYSSNGRLRVMNDHQCLATQMFFIIYFWNQRPQLLAILVYTYISSISMCRYIMLPWIPTWSDGRKRWVPGESQGDPCWRRCTMTMRYVTTLSLRRGKPFRHIIIKIFVFHWEIHISNILSLSFMFVRNEISDLSSNLGQGCSCFCSV